MSDESNATPKASLFDDPAFSDDVKALIAFLRKSVDQPANAGASFLAAAAAARQRTPRLYEGFAMRDGGTLYLPRYAPPAIENTGDGRTLVHLAAGVVELVEDCRDVLEHFDPTHDPGDVDDVGDDITADRRDTSDDAKHTAAVLAAADRPENL